MKTINKPYLAVFLQVIIIGFSFIFVKFALKYLKVLDIMTYRFFLASISVIIFNLFSKDKIKIKIKEFIKILPLAILFPVLVFTSQAYGLLYQSASQAGIISALGPIFTLVFQVVILKEKTNIKQNIMIFISILGLIYMTLKGNKSDHTFSLIGAFYIFFSTICMSLYIVLVRKYTKIYSYKDITYIVIVVGFIILLIINILANNGIGNFIGGFHNFKNKEFLLAIVYLGVFSSFITSILNNYALSFFKASKVAAITNLSPIVTVLAGVFILGESLKIYHVIGILMSLIGIIGINIFKDKKDQPF